MAVTALERVLPLARSIYRVEEVRPAPFLHALCDGCRAAMGGREIVLTEDLGEETDVAACRDALGKVVEGVLRNAVENTPDEGKVEAAADAEDCRVMVRVRDFGTGITGEDQKPIFTGSFHTRDTDRYSTKTSYAFNARGAGADLLRAKVPSEPYGFSIDFDSFRCVFIPEDQEECPGRVPCCPYEKDPEKCRASGTFFFVTIPCGPVASG